MVGRGSIIDVTYNYVCGDRFQIVLQNNSLRFEGNFEAGEWDKTGFSPYMYDINCSNMLPPEAGVYWNRSRVSFHFGFGKMYVLTRDFLNYITMYIHRQVPKSSSDLLLGEGGFGH